MKSKMIFAFLTVMGLAACHSNPYAGMGDRVTPKPVEHKPGLPTGYDVEFQPLVDVTENTAVAIKVLPRVPTPGKPVLTFDSSLPSWCSSFDATTATITCKPSAGAASDPAHPDDTTRSYVVNMKLSSSDSNVVQLSYSFVIAVHHQAVSLSISGFNAQNQILEGQNFQTVVTFQSPDFPNGPFFPTLVNAPAGMTIQATRSANQFVISYNPGYGTITAGRYNPICYDSNSQQHMCADLPFSLTVVDKHGNSSTISVDWSVLDVRQDALVVVPDQVNGTSAGADFYVQVEDLNGETSPQVTVDMAPLGTATPTVASSGAPKGANPYSLVHIVWTGNFSSVKNSTQTLSLKTCVYDVNGSLRQCVNTPVRVKF